MLLAVQEGLGRSKLVVQKTAKKILVIDPDDENCKKLIIKKKSKENINQKKQLKLKNSKNKKLNKKEISTKNIKKPTELIKKQTIEAISINQQLASVTLAQVYKKLGFFEQALLVLNLVKEKDAKNKEVDKEIKIIRKMIKERDSNE